jgi:hypothetical protein
MTDIGTNEAKKDCYRITSWVQLITGMVLTLRIWWLVAELPRFRKVFEGLDVVLPAVTRFALAGGVTIGLAVLMLAVLAKEFMVKNRKVTLIVNGAFVVVVVALNELLTVGLIAPFFNLMHALQNR